MVTTFRYSISMVTAHLGTQKNVIPKLEGLGHVSSHFPLTDVANLLRHEFNLMGFHPLRDLFPGTSRVCHPRWLGGQESSQVSLSSVLSEEYISDCDQYCIRTSNTLDALVW